MSSDGEGRICRHKGDRGECLAPDCNCSTREGEGTVPEPSDDAVEALTNHLQTEWAGPYMARIRDFTEEQIEAGELRVADDRAHGEAKSEARRALTAAWAIDMPRVRAEERAATLRNLRAKLDGMELHDNTGHPRDEGYMHAWQEIADWTAHFNPEAKPDE